ncbi:TIGR02452 family protein [Phytohabitans kaempferiae]|uniref:TIGR02452 family protein n=1 Tax=Phytohabitans kaempferiae TaxID=1620943 RepID=A0ABV6MGZ4_9ACTN
MNNQDLRSVAVQTIAIYRAGRYRTPSGGWVHIDEAVEAAMEGTRLHLPDQELPAGAPAAGPPRIEVTTESTLSAARRLGEGTAALVFASARNPGGGFLKGAVAQEEDVARASALHACLETQPAFYQHHRSDPDLRYSDRVIYSPGVPVFRDDTLALLEVPYRTAMVTAAAPNLGALRANRPDLVPTVPEVIERRAVRVLRVAAAHGHRRLVLGAWGCGVFGNDPAVVASAFAEALCRVDAFDHVTFAVLDPSGTGRTYRTFAATLGEADRPTTSAAGGGKRGR